MDVLHCAKCLRKNTHLNNHNVILTKFYCNECFVEKKIKKVSSKKFAEYVQRFPNLNLYYTFNNKNRKTSLDNPQLLLLKFQEKTMLVEGRGVAEEIPLEHSEPMFTKSLVNMQPYQTFSIDSFTKYSGSSLPVKGSVALIPTGAGKTLIMAGIIEIESKRTIKFKPPYLKEGNLRTVNQTIFVVTPNKLKKNIQQNINNGKIFTNRELKSYNGVSITLLEEDTREDEAKAVTYISARQLVNMFTGKNMMSDNMFFYGRPTKPKLTDKDFIKYRSFSSSIPSPYIFRYDNNGKVVRGGYPQNFLEQNERLLLILEFDKTKITIVPNTELKTIKDSITTEGLRHNLEKNIDILLIEKVTAFYGKNSVIKINETDLTIENSNNGLKIKIILTKRNIKIKTRKGVDYHNFIAPFTTKNVRDYLFRPFLPRGQKNGGVYKIYETALTLLKGTFNLSKITSYIEKGQPVGWKYLPAKQLYVPIEENESELDYLFDPFYGSIIIIDEVEEMINDIRVDIFMLFECIKISGCRVIYLGATLNTVEYFLVMNTLYPNKKEMLPQYGTNKLIPSNPIDKSIIGTGTQKQKKIIGDINKILKYLDIEKLTSIIRSKADMNLKYIFSLAFKIGKLKYSDQSTTPIFNEFGKYTTSFDIKYLRDFISTVKEVKIEKITLDLVTSEYILKNAFEGKNSPKKLEKIIFLGRNSKIEPVDIYGHPNFNLNKTIKKLLRVGVGNGQYIIGAKIANIIKKFIEKSYEKAKTIRNNNNINFTKLMKKICISQGDYTDETIIVPIVPILQAMGIGLRIVERNLETTVSKLEPFEEKKKERKRIMLKKSKGEPLSDEELTVKVTDAKFENSIYFNENYAELKLNPELQGKISCFVLSDTIVNFTGKKNFLSDQQFSTQIADRFFVNKLNTSYIIKSKTELDKYFKLEYYTENKNKGKKDPEEYDLEKYRPKYLNLINNSGLQINFFNQKDPNIVNALALSNYKTNEYFPDLRRVPKFFFVKKKNLVEEKNFMLLEDIEYFLEPSLFDIINEEHIPSKKYYDLLDFFGKYEVNLLKGERNEAQELIKTKFNSFDNRLYNTEAQLLILGTNFQVGIDAKECDALFLNVPRNVVQSVGRFKRQNGSFDIHNDEFPVSIKCKCIYYELNESLNYKAFSNMLEESEQKIISKEKEKEKKEKKKTEEEENLRKNLESLGKILDVYDKHEDITSIKLPGSAFELKFPFYKVEEKKYSPKAQFKSIKNKTTIQYTHEIVRNFDIQLQTFASKTEESIYDSSCIKNFFEPIKSLPQLGGDEKSNSYIFTGLFINKRLNRFIEEFIKKKNDINNPIVKALENIKSALNISNATYLYRSNSIGLVNRRLAIKVLDNIYEFPENTDQLLFDDSMFEEGMDIVQEESSMDIVEESDIKKKYTTNEALVLKLFELDIIYNYNVVGTTNKIELIVSSGREKRKIPTKKKKPPKKKPKTTITIKAKYLTIRPNFDANTLRKQIIVDDSTSVVVEKKLYKIFEFLIKLNILSNNDAYWNFEFSENYLIEEGDRIKTPLQFIEKDIDERFQDMLDSIVLYFYDIEYPNEEPNFLKETVRKKKFIDSLQSNLKLFTIDICPKLSKTVQFLTLFLGKFNKDQNFTLKSFENTISLITVLYKFDFSLLEDLVQAYKSEYYLIERLKGLDFVQFLDNVEQFTRDRIQLHKLYKKEISFLSGKVEKMLKFIKILFVVIESYKFKGILNNLYSSIFYKAFVVTTGVTQTQKKEQNETPPSKKSFLETFLISTPIPQITKKSKKIIKDLIKNNVPENIDWIIIRNEFEYKLFNNILKSLKIDLKNKHKFLRKKVEKYYFADDGTVKPSEKFQIMLEKLLLFISTKYYSNEPFKPFKSMYELVEKNFKTLYQILGQSEKFDMVMESDKRSPSIISIISKVVKKLVIKKGRSVRITTIENDLLKEVPDKTTNAVLPFTYNNFSIYFDPEKDKEKYYIKKDNSKKYFDLEILVNFLLDGKIVMWQETLPVRGLPFSEELVEEIVVNVFKKILRNEYNTNILNDFIKSFLSQNEENESEVKKFSPEGMVTLTSFFKNIKLKEFGQQLQIIKKLYHTDSNQKFSKNFSILIQKSDETVNKINFINILNFMKYYTNFKKSLKVMGVGVTKLFKYLFVQDLLENIEQKIDDLSSIIPKTLNMRKANLYKLFFIIYKDKNSKPFSYFREKIGISVDLQNITFQNSKTQIKELKEFYDDEDVIDFGKQNTREAIEKIVISKLLLHPDPPGKPIKSDPLDRLFKRIRLELTKGYGKM